MELQVHGYELTLRLDDAAQIEVELIDSRSRKHEGPKKISNTAHPGLGEEGKYHVKGSGNPLPDGEKLTYALVGNQNCGKTTLFNQLTGSNQHVGNFPGVTVDRKDGSIKEHPDTSITDLPGIYSMSPYTNEEIVSRNFVLDNKPKGHNKYRRCDKYREKPVSVHTDHGAWYSGCHGNQYDGSGSKERR